MGRFECEALLQSLQHKFVAQNLKRISAILDKSFERNLINTHEMVGAYLKGFLVEGGS